MKIKRLFPVLFTAAFLCQVSAAMAQETMQAKKMPTPRPPVYGIPAKTLPKGLWIIRGYWIHPFFDKKLDTHTGEMISLPDNMTVSSNTAIAKVRYGITSKLTAILNVPFVNKKMTLPDVTKTGTGVGDIVGALLWKFHHNKEKKFLTSLLFYTKYPVGKSYNLATDELPLGTGSFDAGLAFLPEKEFGRFDMRLSAFYIMRGKNKSDINLGDMTLFSWSTAYNASRNFIMEGSWVYKTSGNNKHNGVVMDGTNTYQFQFIPGAQYRIAQTFLVQIAFPVTLTSKMSFDSTIGSWVGLYYLF